MNSYEDLTPGEKAEVDRFIAFLNDVKEIGEGAAYIKHYGDREEDEQQ